VWSQKVRPPGGDQTFQHPSSDYGSLGFGNNGTTIGCDGDAERFARDLDGWPIGERRGEKDLVVPGRCAR
jgi:hypothetical protein